MINGKTIPPTRVAMKKIVFVSLFLCCSQLWAQQTENDDRTKIIGIVNHFFEALEKKDTALYASLVMRNAQIWVTRKVNDTLRTPMRSFAEDIDRLPSYKETLHEKAIGYEVSMHNNIAVVWVPYTFHYNDRLSHCGIDVFTLLKTDKGWKIVSTAYSVEPDACAELQKGNR